MKRKKLLNIICIAVFAAALAVPGLLLFLLPKAAVSDLERRSLASPPQADWDSVASGRFGTQTEEYISDHFPMRPVWVGICARVRLWLGINGADGPVSGRDGRLYTAPAQLDAEAVSSGCGYINDFIDKTGLEAGIMIVPAAGAVVTDELPRLHPPYRDAEIIEAVAQMTAGRAELIDLLPAFRDAEDPGALYYRTDHHWTAAGAYAAYVEYARTVGLEPVDRSIFDITAVDGFYGTTYSSAALWDTAPDTVELWRDPGLSVSVAVHDDGKEDKAEYGDMFFTGRFATSDMYAVYLDGNHSLVRVTNPAAEGTLLVIKDSFANCLVPFLAEHYGEIYMVDLRYYRQNAVSDLVRERGVDSLLFVFGTDTVASGGELMWLK